MNLNKSITASVYVVNKDKVLLHMHKKHKTLFPLGGHMEINEVPHETAIREVFEESGLSIELYNDEEPLDLGRVEQLHRPIHILLENVGQPVENIDFIYFATTNNNELNPQKGESRELHWLSKDDIENNQNIKPHVKAIALEVLNIIK
jgi:ADP-ribose pyrophosphatase YjhB (NUDIX family)